MSRGLFAMEQARSSQEMGPNIASCFLTLSQRKTVLRMLIAVFYKGAYESNSSDPSFPSQTYSRHTEVNGKHECI